MTEAAITYRVRIQFGKLDTLRFIGHLDLAKTWERVLRRADVPLVYSKGFNPQPKMQLAAALPLGISSECELMDIWLQEPVDVAKLPEQLNAVSPRGLITYRCWPVSPKSPALQMLTESAVYRFTLRDTGVDSNVQQHLDEFMTQEHVLRERRGKTYDLRELVYELRLEAPNTFIAHLALGSRGNARPDELLEALGFSFAEADCHRIAINLRPEEITPADHQE